MFIADNGHNYMNIDIIKRKKLNPYYSKMNNKKT